MKIIPINGEATVCLTKPEKRKLAEGAALIATLAKFAHDETAREIVEQLDVLLGRYVREEVGEEGEDAD
jgi:hypothetical protein